MTRARARTARLCSEHISPPSGLAINGAEGWSRLTGCPPQGGGGPVKGPSYILKGYRSQLSCIFPLDSKEITADIWGSYRCTAQDYSSRKGLSDGSTDDYVFFVQKSLLQASKVGGRHLHLPSLQGGHEEGGRDIGGDRGVDWPTGTGKGSERNCSAGGCPPKTRPGWPTPAETEDESPPPDRPEEETDSSGTGDVERPGESLCSVWGPWMGILQGDRVDQRRDRPGYMWAEGRWYHVPPMWGGLPEVQATDDPLLRGQTWA